MVRSKEDPRVYGPISREVADMLGDDNVHPDTVETVRNHLGVTHGAGEMAVGLVVGQNEQGEPTREFVNLDPNDAGVGIRATTMEREGLPHPTQVTFPEQ